MQGLQPTSGPPAVSPALPGSGRTPSIIPLFHAAWLFALGIALAHAVWLRPSLVLIAILPVASVCLVAAWRAERIVWIPLAVLWCLLGAWCAEMTPQPAPSTSISALSDGLLRTVEGTVTDAASVRVELVENVEETANDGPSQRIDLHVASIETVSDTVDEQTPAEGAVLLPARRGAQQEEKRNLRLRLGPLAICHGENSSPADLGDRRLLARPALKGGSAGDTRPELPGHSRRDPAPLTPAKEIAGILRDLCLKVGARNHRRSYRGHFCVGQASN